MLCTFLRTTLSCARFNHPPEVAVAHAEGAVAACLEEFEGLSLVPVLDEFLGAIGVGPTVFVTNPAAVRTAADVAAAKKRRNRKDAAAGKSLTPDPASMPPMQIPQTNPSYVIAARIILRKIR